MLQYIGNFGRSSAKTVTNALFIPEVQVPIFIKLRPSRVNRIGGQVTMKNIIEAINNENLKQEVESFNVGDTVRVSVKVIEGTRERLQAFEGVVIAKRHGGISETFTVRRISFGVGVERTFPLHSPKVAKIEVVRKGKVRRAKLYYLRGLTGKAAKIKEIL